MPKRAKEPAPLTRITQIALELPEVSRRVHGHHAAFLVRKKVFAYFLHNHHGDGIVSLAAKALPGDNTSLVASQPSRFYLPAYVGPRGWVALRLDRAKIDWTEVRDLLVGSYVLCAPKSLANLLNSSG